MVTTAMRLLADAGYVVLKAPNWPRDFAIELQQIAATERRLTKGADNHSSVERASGNRLMTVKEFCKRYSIGRSTAYVEINAKRLKIQKIGRATRISERAATEWLNAWNSARRP